MMTYTEVKSIVQTDLCQKFIEKGFKVKKRPEGFYVFQNTDFGKNVITIDIANYKVVFSMSAAFTVAYREVTEVLKIARGLGENLDIDFSFTMIDAANEKYYSLLHHFQIHTEEELRKWFAIVLEYYERFGIHFFEKFNTLDKIDRELNSHPEQENSYFNHVTVRAETAIVVAKLNKNKNFDALAKTYREELQKLDAIYEYDNVVEYLKGL